MVYLVEGQRTPIGSFLGAFSNLTAPQLGAASILAVLNKVNLSGDLIDEVLMGCVLTSGLGQAPARQAALGAGLPNSTGATTIGKVCGSGMKALLMGRASILAGDAALVLAGGMEAMSQVPHIAFLRNGQKMGPLSLQDAMVIDGLWDPYNNLHMGSCAEACVKKYGFTREQQDDYTVISTQRALASISSGLFHAEITPVSVPQRKKDPLLVSEDEQPGKAKLDKLSNLSPAFEKEGTITAANASSLNDGAAALLLASHQACQENNLKPKAKIVAVATHSQDPLWFTTAPVGAIQKVFNKAGLTLSDIDCFEINEAFAAVAMAAITELKLPPEKVNPRGGAVALGHPIGATGARIVVTLMHTLEQTQGRYGLATLCIGGGEATAIIIENLVR
jgi:acetyl-CoA C-acetyltransferase